MLTTRQFVQEWGQDDLFQFPAELLERVNIPDTAKTFLHEAGLPRCAMFSYEFTFSLLPLQPTKPPQGGMKYPLLTLYPQSRYRLLSHWQNDDPWYYSGGVHPYQYNAIEEGTGQVWWIEDGTGPRELIHSSISQYAEAMLAYRGYIRQFEPEYPEPKQRTALLQELERRLRASDAYALADPPAQEWLYLLWQAKQLTPEVARRAIDELVGEEIPALRVGPPRFWPRVLGDMEFHV